MNLIPSDIVERTWKEREGASQKEVSEAIELMRKEQPVLLDHLITVGEDILNQDERTLLLCLGMVIWQIMSQGDTPLPKITEKMLDEAENSNIKLLEYLNTETDTDFMDTFVAVLKHYPQPELLKFISKALIEAPKKLDCPIRGGKYYKELMLIRLKIVIDCLNREPKEKEA